MWRTAIVVVVLALAHLLGRRLTFLAVTPRSTWLSVAGGVSVAYVFMHLLPELAEGQALLERSVEGVLPSLEHHVWMLALLGLAVFYGLERLALRSRHQRRRAVQADATGGGVFTLHIASFAAYNFLIGYLLTEREGAGLRPLLTYGLAMGLHFLVNDHGLREHHKARYDRVGRWLLAASLLAGGVVLNVMKEELPEQRESRFSAFALGAAAYAALLLAT
ncbi:hypothetical protein [Ramlibacter tataouinensis]|uniref:Candidate membrane protein n=1 Tax=Ramlibacter tataouinensis (strain ATCC BAA-407 / DSM 14655 / LMG 21543 / TTB310) TaxID=365046 RepID=F5Y319_RAMTT|nr:hypothetical protein [Ramlibacter tataouinensis]AEG94899.1 candidate membrane protein [Ramlibacter tataouinensis TTB310]